MSKPKKGTPHPQLPPVDRPIAPVNPEAIESPLQATPNLDDIIGEVLRRRRARDSIVEYARSVDIPGAPMNDDLEAELFKPIETTLALHHRVMLTAIQHTIEKANGRLMIFGPPGMAKSSYTSVVTTAWVSAKYKNYRTIVASYNSKLAWKQSRKARALCRDPKHVGIWPDRPELRKDQKAVDEWALSNGSEVVAGGLMSGITGNRADVAIVDDPVAGREEADSQGNRDKIEQEYRDSVVSRLKPNGSIILIQCMVGDTQVLMADGTEKALRDVRPGDKVATYDPVQAGITTATVLNHLNQGPDRVFTIRTSSGTLVRANERHPFLVEREGGLQWVRLRDLRLGDRMQRVTGVNGGTRLAHMKGATNPPSAKGSVIHTTTKLDGPPGCAPPPSMRLPGDPHISNTGTESRSTSTTSYSLPKEGDALCAENCPEVMCEHTGAESCASIIATTPEKCGDFSVTIATLPSVTERPRRPCSTLLDTCKITNDAIVSITMGGHEDVFDIQVEGTENFIADGVVSHNTRWHEDDLAGRILPLDYAGQSGPIQCRDGMEWYVLNIPAEAEHEDDPLGRKLGDYLWPEWFPAEHWELRKRDPRGQRTWASLYQQRPTAGDGIEFKREWFQWYDPDITPGEPGGRPLNLSLYGASDFATKEDRSADYTEHGVGGLSPIGDLYFVDWYFDQVTSDKYINAWIKMVRRWKPRKWWDEGNVIGQAIAPARTRAMKEANPPIYVKTEQLTSIKNKTIKLASFQQYAANGRVYFPLKRPWAQRVVDQLCAFPAGRYDDAADVCGLFGRGLDEMTNAVDPTPEVKPQLIPFSTAWLEWEENDKPKIRFT